MIPRYTRPELARVWSEENRFQKWLDVELAAAETLARSGALVSTFMTVGRASTLVAAFAELVPELFLRLMMLQKVSHSPEEFARGYASLPVRDFSRDVLSRVPELFVMPLPDCGWVDVGTPSRFAEWSDQTGHGLRESAAAAG